MELNFFCELWQKRPPSILLSFTVWLSLNPIRPGPFFTNRRPGGGGGLKTTNYIQVLSFNPFRPGPFFTNRRPGGEGLKHPLHFLGCLHDFRFVFFLIYQRTPWYRKICQISYTQLQNWRHSGHFSKVSKARMAKFHIFTSFLVMELFFNKL